MQEFFPLNWYSGTHLIHAGQEPLRERDDVGTFMSLKALVISEVDGQASPVNARDGAIMSVMRHPSPDYALIVSFQFW